MLIVTPTVEVLEPPSGRLAGLATASRPRHQVIRARAASGSVARRELEQIARRSQRRRENDAVLRRTRQRVGAAVDRETILDGPLGPGTQPALRDRAALTPARRRARLAPAPGAASPRRG